MKRGAGIGIAVGGICLALLVGVLMLKLKPEPIVTPSSEPRNADTGNQQTLPPTMSPVPTAPDENVPSKERPTFVRAEDAGEDFSLLESSEVIRRLTESNERIPERKAAKVLGDRHLDGKLDLSAEEKGTVEAYVEKQVELTAAETGKDRTEANTQIQRLWRLTADKLIDNLGNKNMTVVEAATKNLALMRDEEIVGKIIERIKISDDMVFREYAIMALGMMREKRDCLVPDRHTLGDEESEALRQRLIEPFLNELQRTEKDPKILQAIKMAFRFLQKPPDARRRRSSGQ